jgi:methylase of polypeptide subunit release factors
MPFYRLRSVGEVFVPEAFASVADDDAPLRVFASHELDYTSRIFGFVRRRGLAVVSGPWDRLTALLEYAAKRKSELAGRPGRGTPLPRRSGREWEKERHRSMMRMMVKAEGDRLVGVEPPMSFPYLLESAGERVGANQDRPLLLPLLWVRDLAAALEKGHPVGALGVEVFVPDKVLVPASQESVSLMAEALGAVRAELPDQAKILDMGSGSGVLTLLAAHQLRDRCGSLVATDVLPEALAATKINVDRYQEMNQVPPGLFHVTDGGDLFTPVHGRKFDLILFNAPWVVSPCRSRTERATHDPNQETLKRFLEGAVDHLEIGGRILLQYSDHSGAEAVECLQEMLRQNAWRVNELWRARVQARRKSPKWETVLVFDLRPDR